MRHLTSLLLWASMLPAGLMAGPAAWAGDCHPEKVSAPYIVELDKDEIDTAHNAPGQVLPDAEVFHLSDKFPMACSCEGGSAALYFRSVSPLPPGYQDGSLTYFILTPWLQVGTKLAVKEDTPLPAPFEDMSDGGSYACGSDGMYYRDTTDVGNVGSLSFYVVKGFTGEMDIPLTAIMDVYARWGTQGGYGTRPTSRLFVFGTLIVPQTCTLDDGQIINVELGTIRRANISVPGQIPVNYVPQQITLDYQCRNITETMHLELSLYGQESLLLPGVLRTSNPDIGVQIADAAMTPLDINNNHVPLPLTFGAQAQTGRQFLYAWPVNTTGRTPATGTFSASALMQVEIQ